MHTFTTHVHNFSKLASITNLCNTVLQVSKIPHNQLTNLISNYICSLEWQSVGIQT